MFAGLDFGYINQIIGFNQNEIERSSSLNSKIGIYNVKHSPTRKNRRACDRYDGYKLNKFCGCERT